MPEDSKVYLPNSDWCFVCGEDNHAGLKTRFYIEDGKVKARIRPSKHHCGYEGVVHGGIIAAIIDECMGWAAARAINRMCVTGELTVRYLINVPDDRELTCVTDIEKANRRMVLTKGEIVDDDGTVYATATAKFLPLSAEKTLEVDDKLLYRGGEERLFDGLRSE
ncbi:MAG: hypothetical protein COA73_10320 [Candidatus Hydrogenedentota bacterium]|nr:MAG: hypothetical protein COA73_10320 [Candidatus Hydrogenedentota bacterium]